MDDFIAITKICKTQGMSFRHAEGTCSPGNRLLTTSEMPI
jgi:hypothetical protein